MTAIDVESRPAKLVLRRARPPPAQPLRRRDGDRARLSHRSRLTDYFVAPAMPLDERGLMRLRAAVYLIRVADFSQRLLEGTQARRLSRVRRQPAAPPGQLRCRTAAAAYRPSARTCKRPGAA